MRGSTLLLHVAIWSGACTAALGQHKAPRHDAAAWVPTEEGTNWSYHRVTSDRDVPASRGEARIAKGVFGTYRRADGSRWHLVAMNEGAGTRWQHWNTEGPGLLVQSTPTALEVAGASTSCALAAPVGAVSHWEWEAKIKDETVARRASLVAFDEVVTVPAGSFRTVRVRVEEFGEKPEPDATEDSWYARDVGLVRLERKAGPTLEVTELLSFARGRDQTQERLATLQMLAPPAWLWTKRGAATVRWLDQDPGSVAFGGRFAIVGDGADLRVAFVRPGACVPLPAEGIQAWMEIASRERRRDDGLVAMTAARVHAARLQLGNATIEDDGHGKATLRGTDAQGEREFSIAAMYSASTNRSRLTGAAIAGPAIEVEIKQETGKR